jgi:uncharacterized protein (TIGR03790 family)
MMRLRFPALLVCLLPLWGPGLCAATPEETRATIVVYNAAVQESKELADFYCSARGIDPSRTVPLQTSTNEEISREDYDGTIAGPLRRIFADRGWWVTTRDMMNRNIVISSTVRNVVLIRGIPLKIRECGDYPGDARIQPAPFGYVNAASVDSEISILGLFSPQISGVIQNPVCNNAARTVFNPQAPPWLLMVARLDAPTPDAVRGMIQDGIKAEKEGLWGWGYIDLRSINDPGYVQGDRWIRRASDEMRRYGIPVITDDLPDTIQSGFPVTDAAAYYGWYSEHIDGPFADPFFRFVPGAVAAHLHSFSAITLRDPSKGWTGPLIMRGAAASVGNVYEPYLGFTTDFGTMASTLLTGASLAEAYYSAQPVLSWMSILVGDPLYRPYACFSAPDSTSPTKSVWTDYRRIVLEHGGNVLDASGDLTARARQGGGTLYLEALGAALMDAGKAGDAEVVFREASAMAKGQVTQFRLLLETARSLEKQGNPTGGASLLRQGLVHFTGSSQRHILLNWISRMDPIVASPGH